MSKGTGAIAADVAKEKLASVDWDAKRQLAQEKAVAAYGAVRRGDVTTQMLCFCGGVAIMVYSVLSLINIFNILSGPFSYVFFIYTALFGMVVSVYEWPANCQQSVFDKPIKSLHDWCDIYFKAFSTLVGRGFIYVAFGILVASKDGWLSTLGIMGLYTIACGVILLIRSFMVKKRLRNVRTALVKKNGPKAAEQWFQKYDMDKDGNLCKEELARLFKDNNEELGGEELNTAMRLMDQNNDGLIQKSEFQAWYSEEESAIEKKLYGATDSSK
eukprot:TRINITY_DN48159_c0_g1_i1.p2 TRINITY_DN48159_c0_g1~~TRINITY_DN48159_c0_g1_i1.p2  ORF type:complete len:272 (+),score=108.94 TRINITY_DN48159_c0_g1_i1:79-894(+)